MKVAVIMDEAAVDDARSGGQAACAALQKTGHDAVSIPVGPTLVDAVRAERPDVALVVADDPSARDGGVQELLELMDVPFVGSDSATCRMAGDASLLPAALRSACEESGDIPAAVPLAGFRLSKQAVDEWGAPGALDLCDERVPGGYPMAVRLARAEHALRVDDRDALAAAVGEALNGADAVLIEQWVEGLELTVAVLGSGWDAYALPPVEAAVREDGSVELVAPVRLASLSPDEAIAQAVRAEVERAALDAYRACGVSDWGCVHAVWDGAQVRVVAVDPAPSVAEGSAFVAALEASGLSLAGVLDRLVTL